MTQLNLQKRAVKTTLIIVTVLTVVCIGVLLPIDIVFTNNYLSKIKKGDFIPYDKSLALLALTVILILIFLFLLIRWLILFFKFKKITFPTEEKVTVLCKKVSIGGLKGLEILTVKTKGKKFIYISSSSEDLQIFKENCSGKTIELKLYANTNLIKKLK